MQLLKTFLPLREREAVKDKGYGILVRPWFGLAKIGVESKENKNEKENKGKEGSSPSDAVNSTGYKQPSKKTSTQGSQPSKGQEPISGEDAITKILVDNPSISAATLLNLIKSKGFKIVSEADSSSVNTAVLRGKTKEGKKYEDCLAKVSKQKGIDNPYAVCAASLGTTKESKSSIQIRARFLESSPKNDAVGWTRIRCILIEEGMGNSRDAFYYDRTALESAVPIFEGKKIFADHPTMQEDQVRPERSVRDVLGHYENVVISESDNGQACLEADVVILPDDPYRWARGLLRHAVEYSKKYPDKDFVGLSINANGEAEPTDIDKVIESAPDGAKQKLIDARDQMGLKEVRVVSKIEDAVSCDLVTEAGAGGKVLNLIEQEKEMGKKPTKNKENEEIKKNLGKPTVEAEDEKAGGGDDDGGEDADHPDAEQDKELIKKMVAKHLGDKVTEAESSEAEGIAHNIHKEALEMGYSEEEAMKCAEAGLRAAMKMAKAHEAKQAESESEENESESESESEAHKESATVKLTARIAFLESKIKKQEAAAHLEILCKESGLPMIATKKFKDMPEVSGAKSPEELDKLMKIFKEAFGAGGSKSDSSGVYTVEKQNVGEGGKAVLSFEDCLN